MTVHDKKQILYKKIADEFSRILYSPLSDYPAENSDESRILKAKKVYICSEIKRLLFEFLEDITDEDCIDRFLMTKKSLIDYIFRTWSNNGSGVNIQIALLNIIQKI